MAEEITKIEDVSEADGELVDLQKRVSLLEQLASTLSSRNLGGLDKNDLLSITSQNWGDGLDGDVTITGTTTLTRDMFYNTLIINASGVLKTNGFRVFCKTSLLNNGTIDASGGSASGATAGAAAHAQGSLPAAPAGKAGGAAGPNFWSSSGSGGNGTAGDDAAKSVGGAGGGGGGGGGGGNCVGGGGGSVGGSGGGGGSQTGTVYNIPRTPTASYLFSDTLPSLASLSGSAGSGSGGGGGGGRDYTAGPSYAGGNGGAGGGSGAAGGIISIFSKEIINNGVISANGGNGGNGANGANGNPAGGYMSGGGGGGGAGAGGAGGVVMLTYGQYSGSGTVTATKGANGTPGNYGAGYQNGAAGAAASSATDGTVIRIQLS
jgi:hypothetical protein